MASAAGVAATATKPAWAVPLPESQWPLRPVSLRRPPTNKEPPREVSMASAAGVATTPSPRNRRTPHEVSMASAAGVAATS